MYFYTQRLIPKYQYSYIYLKNAWINERFGDNSLAVGKRYYQTAVCSDDHKATCLYTPLFNALF